MPALSRPLVMAADDDGAVLEFLELWLHESDFRAVCVPNKARLLEQLARERPSLLLLDLNFGKYDGIEVMRVIDGTRDLPSLLP